MYTRHLTIGGFPLFAGLCALSLAACMVVGLPIGFAGAALAQAVATTAVPVTDTVVNVSNPIIAFLTAAGGIGAAVAFFVVKYLLAKIGASGILKDDVIRKYLTEGFEMAVHYAVSKVATADWTKIDTKNAAIAQAAAYVLDHFPDALAYFGYDTTKLQSVIEARLSALYPDLVATATDVGAEPGVA